MQNSKYKFDLDLWPFDLKFNRDSIQVMENTSVKYHHFFMLCQMVIELSRRNDVQFKFELDL